MANPAMSLLALANAILSGAPVTKAEAAVEDPDAINGADTRAEGGAATQETVDAAREEAQASQQAAAPAPGEGGAPGAPGAEGEGGGEGGEGGEKGDADDAPIAKAEILESMKFLASMHNISGEEVAKAFSGLEGDPTSGKAPVGAGVEILQKIVEGQENHSKILDAIAGFLAEMSKHHVSLSSEVTKSLVASEAAQGEAAKVSAALAGIMKTAPAATPKALTPVEVTKSEGAGSVLTSNDLFQAALKGDLSPHQAAAQNRLAHYGRS